MRPFALRPDAVVVSFSFVVGAALDAVRMRRCCPGIAEAGFRAVPAAEATPLRSPPEPAYSAAVVPGFESSPRERGYGVWGRRM